jgi:peptide/nickel transport system substrate-binding protein
VGVLTGGAAETIDPAKAINVPDYCRVWSLFDPMFEFNSDGSVTPVLLEEASVDDSAQVWTLRLKEGITFHDGSSLDATTLMDNILAWSDSAHYAYGTLGVLIDSGGVTKLDARTVRIPLKTANARFPELCTTANALISKPGATKDSPPIGTGAFVLGDFQPGSSSTFTRNPNYWRAGQPYLDQLTVVSSFRDDSARYNALVGGEVDAMPYMPYLQAKSAANGGQVTVLRSPSTQFYAFYMRVDTPPFDDVRVRQAVRFACDRQALVDTVFAGLGSVGNDLAPRDVQFYDASLKRDQDIEQARSLLREAGQEGLKLTFQTSGGAAPGFNEAAALLQEQARSAGMDIKLQSEDPGQYFNASTLYLKMPFAQTYWTIAQTLQLYWSQALTSSAPYNETHWRSERTDKLFAEANAAKDDGLAEELWHELQQEQFNEGGYVIWGYQDTVDGLSPKVKGLEANLFGNLDNYRLARAWMA